MHPDFTPPPPREVVRSRDGITIAVGVALVIVGVLATGAMWSVLFGWMP